MAGGGERMRGGQPCEAYDRKKLVSQLKGLKIYPLLTSTNDDEV